MVVGEGLNFTSYHFFSTDRQGRASFVEELLAGTVLE